MAFINTATVTGPSNTGILDEKNKIMSANCGKIKIF